MTVSTEVGLPALQHLAYSEESDPNPVAGPGRYSWWWVIDRAALFTMLAGLAAAGIVVAAHHHTSVADSPMPPPAATAPSPTVEPPPVNIPAPVIPPDIDHRLVGDDWYLSMVGAGSNAHGWSITDPAGSIRDGHAVCTFMARGHTPTQTVDQVVSESPSIEPGKARELAQVIVDAAIRAYCPN